MKKIQPFILSFLFFCLISSINTILHQQQTQTPQDLYFAKLNEQQMLLEDKINALLLDMNNVQKNVSSTPEPNEKVLMLEKAILSQRQKVFDMQNQLIPPFSLSKTACLQMTNQQKIDMLDKVKATKTELTNLQQQIAITPKCDKLDALQIDTQKQLALLQSLEKTIYTECQSKSILTPTIYQTNIYANGWILGDQDIDDLIQEYYQRNIRYHNITNCPLDKPFFNGKQCIICYDPEPVFNIVTKQCTHCPEDQEPDSNLRKCAWRPHYTNFSSVQNWARDGALMPVPPRQLLPCPAERPYYNGKKCEICLMPKYWNIKKNSCVQCPTGTIFDINDRRCEKPETNEMTILQGTRWVTNDCNLTRIISQRVRVLNENATLKSYKYCPSQKPFYDGVVCISCPNQFNIDNRKCVSSPAKALLYDENSRCYLEKKTGFQTDPRAASYTTSRPLIDSPIPNCKNATPYYDGIACVDCLNPFPIFDVDTRRCTACNAMEIYNSTQHKCILRKKLYISTNSDKLMSTPLRSVDDYHAEIAQKIYENPDAIIFSCKGVQYSDFINCFNCSNTQYFNVQTKKCQTCDGTINPITKVCLLKSYIYTNLNQDSVKRIFEVPTTIENENITINKNINLHNSSRLCPATQPYFDGSICTNCTRQGFNMITQQCIPIRCTDPQFPAYNTINDRCEQCPKNSRYVEQKKICETIVYVTNTNAIYFYIEQGVATKKSLEDQIFNLQLSNSVISCDASHPYWNGTECIDCSITRNVQDIGVHKPYFNLLTLQCQSCEKWDNETHKCLDKIDCFQPTPILNLENNLCEACPYGTQYNIYSKLCQPCLSGTQYNPNTKSCQPCQYGTEYSQITKSCQPCSPGTQYNSNTKSCQSCPSGTQYNLNTKTCQPCPSGTQFNQNTKSCETCPFGTQFNSNTRSCQPCQFGTQFNSNTKSCQPCSSGTEYNSNTKSCQPCPPGTQYNQNTKSCQACTQGKIYNSLTLKCQQQVWVTDTNSMINNYIQEGNATKDQLVSDIQKLKSTKNVKVCPSETPFFFKNQGNCMSCASPTPYFNLLSSTCSSCENYNTSSHQCEKKVPRFNMNVEDFYGTIFT